MSTKFSVISDLRPNAKSVNLKFKVVKMNEPHEVTSRRDGSTHKVVEAIVGDETGIIKMTLWDSQIDQVEEEKTYELLNGYVSFFQNTLRLNIGRYGEIKESDEEISNVNMDNDLSEKVYQRQFNRRRYDSRGRGGYGTKRTYSSNW